MAREHPSVFRHVGIIKVLDSHGMGENGSGPNALGHAIHEGQRPAGGGEIEPGIYFGQSHFIDKRTTDLEAANDRARNWNISGTAEGTLYHEFGHVIERRVPEKQRTRDVTETAREHAKHRDLLLDRRTLMAERLAEAPSLEIPVREDGAPAVLNVGSARWLGVTTTGTPARGWRIPEDCTGWERITLDRLVSNMSDDTMLYIDEQGPLLPVRDIRR
jgi:hypothetical protein